MMVRAQTTALSAARSQSRAFSRFDYVTEHSLADVSDPRYFLSLRTLLKINDRIDIIADRNGTPAAISIAVMAITPEAVLCRPLATLPTRDVGGWTWTLLTGGAEGDAQRAGSSAQRGQDPETGRRWRRGQGGFSCYEADGTLVASGLTRDQARALASEALPSRAAPNGEVV
ncbi:MAG: hypothetical protein ACFB6R_14490 [Alphaproteobacteria bacterium]